MSKVEELTNYLKSALIFPKEIHLESSSRCNSSCITCPRDKMQRQLGEMSREIFVKAVNETADYDMDYIMLHLNGEPLLLDIDELVWRVNYARDINPRCKQINFFTNGSLLTPEIADKLLLSKLDLIMISIDGGNQEDYEKIRKGLSWKTLTNNVYNLVKRKRELKSNLFIQTAIIPQVANQNSVRTYFSIFSAMGVDHVAGSGVNNIGGLIDADNMKLSTQRNDVKAINLPCFKIFLDLDICSDGRALICSQDVVGTLPIGDLNNQTLQEIWQGSIISEIRKKFILRRKQEIPFCGKCDFMTGFVYPEWWDISKEEWLLAYEAAVNCIINKIYAKD